MTQNNEDPEPNIPQIKSANSVSFNDIHIIGKQHNRFSISSQPSLGSSNTNKRIPSENYVSSISSSRSNSTSNFTDSNPNSNTNLTSNANDFLQIDYNHAKSIKLINNKKKSTKTIIASPIEPPVPFTNYLQKQDDGKLHILIGSTGSVATIKVPLIIDKLFKIYGEKVSIQLIVTEASSHFLKGLKINNQVKIWRDNDEWISSTNQSKSQDPNIQSQKQKQKQQNVTESLILHNELRKWADCLLIAPLSANTLAKITNGICDNLLSCIVRSWNPIKPILIAPAMNTFMYTHPMTRRHILQLTQDCPYIEVLKPVEKVLVCGDIGMGGMREWSDIVEILRKKLINIATEKGKKFDEEDDEDEDDNDDENDRNGTDDSDDDDSDDDEDEEDEEADDDKDSASEFDNDLIFDTEPV